MHVVPSSAPAEGVCSTPIADGIAAPRNSFRAETRPSRIAHERLLALVRADFLCAVPLHVAQARFPHAPLRLPQHRDPTHLSTFLRIVNRSICKRSTGPPLPLTTVSGREGSVVPTAGPSSCPRSWARISVESFSRAQLSFCAYKGKHSLAAKRRTLDGSYRAPVTLGEKMSCAQLLRHHDVRQTRVIEHGSFFDVPKFSLSAVPLSD
jgi:hypothetical protein